MQGKFLSSMASHQLVSVVCKLGLGPIRGSLWIVFCQDISYSVAYGYNQNLEKWLLIQYYAITLSNKYCFFQLFLFFMSSKFSCYKRYSTKRAHLFFHPLPWSLFKHLVALLVQAFLSFFFFDFAYLSISCFIF